MLGDSWVDADRLATLEEHGHRPEIVEARAHGVGRARRVSATVDTEMLYTAVTVHHADVAFVRLAVPAADVQQQLWRVVPLTLLATALGTAVALAFAWAFSIPLSRRVAAIARVADRYAAGEFTRPPIDYGSDELGRVARSLDAVVLELGGRLTDLARNRARMEAILAGMVEGVLVLDEDGRLRLVNGAARRMLGITDAGIDRRYTDSIRHPDVVAQIGRALRGEQPPGVELILGLESTRVVIARATPARDTSGHGAVLVLHDITDLRRADQVRRDFVGNVSHELRTPLTAIRGYVETLLDEIEDGEAREFLQIIFRHTTRMERLVAGLLRLARLDARQEMVELAPASLRRIVDGVVDELAPLIEARRADVRVLVDDDVPPVETDAARVHDVLRNLVENAVSYSPEGGTVWLHAAVSGDRADDRSGRQRTGDPDRGSAARVRTVLPGGQVEGAERGRHRDRARDREEPRGAARGDSHRAESRRGGRRVHGRLAGASRTAFRRDLTHCQPSVHTTSYVTAAMNAAAGIVNNQAHTICPATPHRTADRRRVAPTPTIAPVIVCVVLIPTPKCVAMKIALAAPVSAANPLTGCSRVIFEPIVWMMRQPPDSVPSPMAAWAASTTQNGM